MESILIKKAAENGIWALACVLLVYYILKEQKRRDLKQEERECKYQNIIQELSKSLEVVFDLDYELKELKKLILSKVINSNVKE